MGWIGVDLFFVLSGFLVSGLLFQEYQATRRIQPGRFLLRRGLKIYPQFYFFIAATLAIACFKERLRVFRRSSLNLLLSGTTFLGFGDTRGRWMWRNTSIFY